MPSDSDKYESLEHFDHWYICISSQEYACIMYGWSDMDLDYESETATF